MRKGLAKKNDLSGNVGAFLEPRNGAVKTTEKLHVSGCFLSVRQQFHTYVQKELKHSSFTTLLHLTPHPSREKKLSWDTAPNFPEEEEGKKMRISPESNQLLNRPQ